MASTINASNTGFGGIVQTGDSSGTLALQAAGTTVATVSSTGLAVTGSITTGGVVGSPYSMKNRIINGAMVIFQRGTAATTDLSYSVDRWRLVKSNDASESVSQNTDAPTGFSYSLRNTIATGDATIGSTQYSGFEQAIEGYNVADLGWGTANAKTVTLSFWVRSSVTGTYTGNLRNSNDTRINPFNFTINVANTWEQKTITITGDTGGTWQTTTSTGIIFAVYAALGSSYTGGTSGTWGTTPAFGCGSPVNGIASNGNIFAISGVQLEAGSSATSFEWRPYGMELQLCQRYYVSLPAGGVAWSTTACSQTAQPYVPLRPGSVTATYSGTLRNSSTGGAVTWTGTVAYQNTTNSGTNILFFYGTPTPALTAGNSYDGGSGALITVSAEL